MNVVDFIPSVNSLGRISSLAYGETLPVLGIPVEFRTNSRYVLRVVEESFGTWRRLEAPTSSVSLVVRIAVIDGDEGGAVPSPVRHFCPDPQHFVANSFGSVGVCDPLRRESVAYVTTALAADREHFRASMLEALTFALVAQFDRHPLHAAAIARNGRVALLVGESGAGKSTLAYLARSAGFDVLAEDHAWIELEPELRVWGGVSRVRLGDDAAVHFPDAPSVGVMTTVGGKTKLAVDIESTTDSLVVTDPVVCLLTRANGVATIERADPDAIFGALTSTVSPGFDRFPERHQRVARALTTHGGWRLRLSSDPRQALPLLEQILAR
jgi:hypothetical protein